MGRTDSQMSLPSGVECVHEKKTLVVKVSRKSCQVSISGLLIKNSQTDWISHEENNIPHLELLGVDSSSFSRAIYWWTRRFFILRSNAWPDRIGPKTCSIQHIHSYRLVSTLIATFRNQGRREKISLGVASGGENEQKLINLIPWWWWMGLS